MKTNFIQRFSLVTGISVVLSFMSVRASAEDYSTLVAAAARVEPGQSQEPLRKFEELRGAATNAASREEVEMALTQLLKSDSSFLAKKFACQQLGIIGTEDSIPSLAALLASDETVGIACLAFTTYPPGKADAALRAAVTGASSLAKSQLLQTLGDRRDPKALKLFATCALDNDPRVAETAIAALGKNGAKSGAKELEVLAKNPAVPRRAVLEAMLAEAQAMATAGDRRAAAHFYEILLKPQEELSLRRAAFDGLTRFDKDGGQARIVRLLKSDDTSLRPAAIAAVGRSNKSISSKPLVTLLPGLTAEEQASMIEGLSGIGDAPALAAAQLALTSENAQVRQAAIAAVAKMAGKDSVPALVDVMKTAKAPEDAQHVESALVSLSRDKAIDQALATELGRAENSVRARLLMVIIQRQGALATPLLLTEADSSSPVVAKTAFRGLAKTAEAQDTPVVISKLLRPLAEDVRSEAEAAATAALSRVRQISLRSHAVRDALARADTSAKKISLLNLMPVCADQEALNTVKDMLGDPDTGVATGAAEALSEWPSDEAWEPLLAIYLKPGDEPRRSVALKGMLRLLSESNARINEQSLARFGKLVESARNDADRRQILGALGGAAHPSALTLAQSLVSNPNVRAEAEAAVRRIAEAIKSSHPQAAESALKAITSPK